MSRSVIPLRVLSRRKLAYCSRGSAPKPQRLSELRTLDFSLRSFSHSDPLFSITSALFLQNTRGGIPPRDIVRCTEAQKRLSVSPLLATLMQTPGMGVPRSSLSSFAVSVVSAPLWQTAVWRGGGVLQLAPRRFRRASPTR